MSNTYTSSSVANRIQRDQYRRKIQKKTEPNNVINLYYNLYVLYNLFNKKILPFYFSCFWGFGVVGAWALGLGIS